MLGEGEEGGLRIVDCGLWVSVSMMVMFWYLRYSVCMYFSC